MFSPPYGISKTLWSLSEARVNVAPTECKTIIPDAHVGPGPVRDHSRKSKASPDTQWYLLSLSDCEGGTVIWEWCGKVTLPQ